MDWSTNAILPSAEMDCVNEGKCDPFDVPTLCRTCWSRYYIMSKLAEDAEAELIGEEVSMALDELVGQESLEDDSEWDEVSFRMNHLLSY